MLWGDQETIRDRGYTDASRLRGQTHSKKLEGKVMTVYSHWLHLLLMYVLYKKKGTGQGLYSIHLTYVYMYAEIQPHFREKCMFFLSTD